MGTRTCGALAIAVAGLLLGGCKSSSGASPSDAGVPFPIDRSGLTDAGTTGHLDYSDPNLWLCRPGIDPNECDANLDTTDFLPDGTRQVVPHTKATNPSFDCFYVYPTVTFGSGNETNFSDVSPELDPLLSQAARFNQICEVYAPLYRQVAISLGGTGGDGGVGTSGDIQLPIQDITDAFHYYLDHFNHGRNFVIMGHSQGSAVLTAVMQTEVIGHPDVLSHMISALLIGGGVQVHQPGDTTALPPCSTLSQTDCISLPGLPLCAAPGDTGCVVAYSSYRAEAPPDPATAIFGRGGTHTMTACVNPATLSGNTGKYIDSYDPVHFYNQVFMPTNATLPNDITTPFASDPRIFQGSCVTQNIGGEDFTYLAITLSKDAGDVRPDPPYYSTLQEAVGFGLHVADYNLSLDDLIQAVAQQAANMP